MGTQSTTMVFPFFCFLDLSDWNYISRLEYVSKDSPAVATSTCKAGAFRIHFVQYVNKSQNRHHTR